MVSPNPEATDRELLEYLIRREQEHQKRLDVLERTVRDLPDRWRKEMAALRREMEGLSRELVRQLADARLRLRMSGSPTSSPDSSSPGWETSYERGHAAARSLASFSTRRCFSL
jgi:hypothetical protein